MSDNARESTKPFVSGVSGQATTTKSDSAVPYKDFSDLYDKMSGKGESASGRTGRGVQRLEDVLLTDEGKRRVDGVERHPVDLLLPALPVPGPLFHTRNFQICMRK